MTSRTSPPGTVTDWCSPGRPGSEHAKCRGAYIDLEGMVVHCGCRRCRHPQNPEEDTLLDLRVLAEHYPDVYGARARRTPQPHRKEPAT